MKTFFSSDHHFGHRNILGFKRADGSPLRSFPNIEAHDETIILRHNSLVSPDDKVYLIGDVSMDKKSLKQVTRLNGRKTLLLGNHDIYNAEEYLKVVQNLRAVKVFPKHGLIVSHYPIHPRQFEGGTSRWKACVHGHTHSNHVECAPHHRDPMYINLCLEETDYYPVEFNELLERIPK